MQKLVGKRVGWIVLRPDNEVKIESFRESSHVSRCDASPARNLQPPGLVQPRRAVGRTDRARRSAHRCGAAARRRRGPDRPAADRADVALHPVRDPRRSARRSHFAALGNGGLGGAARCGVGRNSAADLARANDAATAFAARLHRGMRHRGLQRRRTRFGAVAGDVETITCGERADRTGAHDRIRQRPRTGWRAGRMGRGRARLRICRGVVRDRSRAAVGHL